MKSKPNTLNIKWEKLVMSSESCSGDIEVGIIIVDAMVELLDKDLWHVVYIYFKVGGTASSWESICVFRLSKTSELNSRGCAVSS